MTKPQPAPLKTDRISRLTAADMHLAAYYSMSQAVRLRYLTSLRTGWSQLDELWEMAA